MERELSQEEGKIDQEQMDGLWRWRKEKARNKHEWRRIIEKTQNLRRRRGSSGSKNFVAE